MEVRCIPPRCCLSPPKPPANNLSTSISFPSRSSSLTTRTNTFFSSAAKSKPIRHVLKLFHFLPTRDTATWNTAIAACLRHRRADAAVRLFLDMLLSGSPVPDSLTIRLALRASSEANDYQLLPQIHAYVLKLREQLSSSELTILSTCLLNSYRKFGHFQLAHKLFCGMPDKDIVSYTSILMGYMEDGRHAEALRIFQEMVESDQFMLNEHAYSCALRACSSIPALFDGRQIHARVFKSRMVSDVVPGTSLVDLYVKCGEMECARRAFTEISEPSVVSWNALMAGKLDGEEGLLLFGRMRFSGVNPDHVTFANLLRACGDGVGTEEVRQLHGIVMKVMEVEVDVFVSSALFEAYIDHGCFDEAQKVFVGMVEKDDVAYNLAIQGYNRDGHAVEAVNLFIDCLKMGKELRKMTLSSILKEAGLYLGKQLHALTIKFGFTISDGCGYLLSSFISMYLDHHLLDDALSIFEQVHQKDLVLWTSLISEFSRIGENQVALMLYVRMVTEESLEPPNQYTFSALLSSCAQIAAMEEGKQIHAQIIKSNLRVKSDNFVASSLLCMYAKCGYIEEAIRLFEDMPKRDLATWNAMISGLAQHGFAERAIETFEELVDLKKPEPNDITYAAVLSACNHCRLLEKGYQYFEFIKEPTVDHYACIIDMFARAGRLKEAVDFVEQMPSKGNEHIWSSLLTACCTHRNIELGEYTAKKLLALNPTDSGTYIALSNLYAVAGRWDNVEHVRKLMKSRADRKHPGLSWLNINSQQYAFLSGGRSYVSQ